MTPDEFDASVLSRLRFESRWYEDSRPDLSALLDNAVLCITMLRDRMGLPPIVEDKVMAKARNG